MRRTSSPCSNCTGLNLSCDGYGPRLAWLDGGVLEKSQAVKIKRIVKQTIKRRSRSLSRPVPFPDISLPTALPTSSVSSEEASTSESVLCSTTSGLVFLCLGILHMVTFCLDSTTRYSVLMTRNLIFLQISALP